jgi:ATP-binding cassette, subfamily B, multidrug efflux pump
MTNATVSTDRVKSANPPENDWRLLLRLVPYARRSGGLLILSFGLLIPLAIANAVQPLIIGQAISKIRGEKTWDFVSSLSMLDGLNILTLLLLVTVVIRCRVIMSNELGSRLRRIFGMIYSIE